MDIVIILMLAVGAMWLMTSRTRKQQKKAADFRASLGPGQEVMTGSGLFGTIVAVDDDVITLETSPGVTSRWLRPAIAKLVEPPVVADEDEDGPDEEYDDEEYDDAYEDEDGEFLEDEAGELDEDELDTDEDELDTDEDEPEDAPADLDDVEIPDDVSSLTTDPGEGETPRR